MTIGVAGPPEPLAQELIAEPQTVTGHDFWCWAYRWGDTAGRLSMMTYGSRDEALAHVPLPYAKRSVERRLFKIRVPFASLERFDD